MMNPEFIGNMGLTPRDVFSVKSLTLDDVRPEDYSGRAARLPKRSSEMKYLWKIKTGTRPGTFLALSLLCTEMLGEPELLTPHYNDLLTFMVDSGIDLRRRSKRARRFISTGLVGDIAEEVGLDIQFTRMVFRGLRASGVVVADLGQKARLLLKDQVEQFIEDYQTLPPSAQKVKPEWTGDCRKWYNDLATCGRRMMGGFFAL